MTAVEPIRAPNESGHRRALLAAAVGSVLLLLGTLAWAFLEIDVVDEQAATLTPATAVCRLAIPPDEGHDYLVPETNEVSGFGTLRVRANHLGWRGYELVRADGTVIPLREIHGDPDRRYCV